MLLCALLEAPVAHRARVVRCASYTSEQVKKALKEKEGTFRAMFEDKVRALSCESRRICAAGGAFAFANR